MEHKFKVRFIYKIGKVKEERWGTATVVGGTLEDAIKDVKDGYKRLGQKVLEIVAVWSSNTLQSLKERHSQMEHSFLREEFLDSCVLRVQRLEYTKR